MLERREEKLMRKTRSFLSGGKSLEILWKIHYNPACGHEIVTKLAK